MVEMYIEHLENAIQFILQDDSIGTRTSNAVLHIGNKTSLLFLEMEYKEGYCEYSLYGMGLEDKGNYRDYKLYSCAFPLNNVNLGTIYESLELLRR